MSWAEHAIFWHVYPLGFTAAPTRPTDAERALTHRLADLQEWVDYAVGLGTNGLLLGPIFQSATHGYDTTDYFQIDSRLGDDGDFDALVARCHEAGVRVVLDGVFNHVSAEHADFRQALAEGPGGAKAELFHIDFDQPGTPHANFEGHDALVALNHESPQVEDLVVDVMRHWLGRGADGWRLDAAYAVAPEFWSRVLNRVRPEFPGAWFFGEMIHGDYAGYRATAGLDSITQYELWKAIWSSLRDANFYELDHAMGRHNELLGAFVPQTFVGNHDTSRIATQVGPAKARLALAILMTTAGVPSIYYGDEFGMTGLKEEREGGDDAVRPAFPAEPSGLGELGAGAQGLYDLHRALISLRRRHPWLLTARATTLELSNTQYSYRVQPGGGVEGEQWLEVHLNLDDGETVRIQSPAGTELEA